MYDFNSLGKLLFLIAHFAPDWYAQFAPESGAHFAPVLYAHFTPVSGAQFDRIFQLNLSFSS
jgi:hypothetical protein